MLWQKPNFFNYYFLRTITFRTCIITNLHHLTTDYIFPTRDSHINLVLASFIARNHIFRSLAKSLLHTWNDHISPESIPLYPEYKLILTLLIKLSTNKGARTTGRFTAGNTNVDISRSQITRYRFIARGKSLDYIFGKANTTERSITFLRLA